MSPEEIAAFKTIGWVFGIIASGFTGAKINHRHHIKKNGRSVPQTECDLRHATEKVRWENLQRDMDEIKNDIRHIRQRLTG